MAPGARVIVDVRSIHVVDTEIAVATEALEEARRRRDAFISHLLRLFGLNTARQEQVAAVEAAQARLDALFAERAAAIEEYAIRALIPALATRAEPPPAGEPLAPLEEALDLLGKIVAALQEAERHLQIVEPYGEQGVVVTSGDNPFRDGGVRLSLSQGLAAARRASALANALAAHDSLFVLPMLRTPPSSLFPLPSTITEAHAVGRNVREVLDAALALAERLAARRVAAVGCRRARAAWARTRRPR